MSEWSKGTLIMLIGPSGAGKSSYVQELIKTYGFYPDCLISTDNIRGQLCLDFRDQSKNKQVFEAFHAIIRERINHGLLVVADATNLKLKDRAAITGMFGNDIDIEYHIIDRPLETKLNDGGWRLEVIDKNGKNLVERHHETFISNLPQILRGDDDDRVTVFDMRIMR